MRYIGKIPVEAVVRQIPEDADALPDPRRSPNPGGYEEKTEKRISGQEPENNDHAAKDQDEEDSPEFTGKQQVPEFFVPRTSPPVGGFAEDLFQDEVETSSVASSGGSESSGASSGGNPQQEQAGSQPLYSNPEHQEITSNLPFWLGRGAPPGAEGSFPVEPRIVHQPLLSRGRPFGISLDNNSSAPFAKYLGAMNAKEQKEQCSEVESGGPFQKSGERIQKEGGETSDSSRGSEGHLAGQEFPSERRVIGRGEGKKPGSPAKSLEEARAAVLGAERARTPLPVFTSTLEGEKANGVDRPTSTPFPDAFSARPAIFPGGKTTTTQGLANPFLTGETGAAPVSAVITAPRRTNVESEDERGSENTRRSSLTIVAGRAVAGGMSSDTSRNFYLQYAEKLPTIPILLNPYKPCYFKRAGELPPLHQELFESKFFVPRHEQTPDLFPPQVGGTTSSTTAIPPRPSPERRCGRRLSVRQHLGHLPFYRGF